MNILYLDAGHGGLDPITKKYTTPPTTGKYWKHNRGEFHSGGTFYEGVSNRAFAEEVAKYAISKGIRVVPVYHEWEDNSLASRCDLANFYDSKIGTANSIFVSLHSNAVGTQDKAEGFSVWTTKGVSKSDAIADKIFAAVEPLAKQFAFKMRANRADGDNDYEENFYVVANTKMPSVLIENLFFDNYNDAMILMKKEYQAAFAKAVVDSLF